MSRVFRLFISIISLSLLLFVTFMVPHFTIEEHAAYFFPFYSVLCLAFSAMIMPQKEGLLLFKTIGFFLLVTGIAFLIYSTVQDLYEGKASEGKYYVYLKDDPAQFYLSAIIEVGLRVGMIYLVFDAFRRLMKKRFENKNRPVVASKYAEEIRSNVWTVSEIDFGGAIIISIVVLICMMSLILQVTEPWLMAIIIAAGAAYLFYSFIFRSVTLDKGNKTLIVIRQLFARWTITKKQELLSNYSAARIRVKIKTIGTLPTATYRREYLVELIGLHGANLLLKSFGESSDARDLRDSVAKFLNVNVLFDPSYPNDRI